VKTALLDVNLLIALVWPTHEHHDAAHVWFRSRGRARWATCPLTELAFVRIVSNPAFSRDAPDPAGALTLLLANLDAPGHEFWPADLSGGQALGEARIRLEGASQVTDAYLLALARARRGVLASFDEGIRRWAPPDLRPALEAVPPR